MKILCAAVFCVGAGLALPASAQMDQGSQNPFGQQPSGQQFNQQQYGQQQYGQQGQQSDQQGQQFGQQRLSEQRIRQFFGQLERVLQQTARTQDPAALKSALRQYISDDATMTAIAQLYVGENHVATTVAQVPEEMVGDALGFAASVLQGRKLVSDYSINIRVRNIHLIPGQNAARVRTVIEESGDFLAPEAGAKVAQRPGQQLGSRQDQAEEQGQGQGQMAQRGQRQQEGQQQRGMGMGMGSMGMGHMGMGQMGMGQMGMGQGRGGAGGAAQGVPFQVRSTCLHDVGLEDGQIRIGNSFCRSTMRLQG